MDRPKLLKKSEIPLQKEFTKKQLRLIERLEDLMDKCGEAGLVGYGQNDFITIAREDNYKIAYKEHEGDGRDYPMSSEGRAEHLQTRHINSEFYRDSGGDDMVFYK